MTFNVFGTHLIKHLLENANAHTHMNNLSP